MKQAETSFRSNPIVKKRAVAVAHRLQMSLSTYLNMSMALLGSYQRLPFISTKIKPKSSKYASKSDAKEIQQLAFKKSSVEDIKTDKHGNVINPQKHPDFVNWMING